MLWKTWPFPHSLTTNQHCIWRKLWQLRLPYKVLIFELKKQGITENDICPMCQRESESVNHLFKDCSFPKAIWFGRHMNFRIDTIEEASIQLWLYQILNTIFHKDSTNQPFSFLYCHFYVESFSGRIYCPT